MPLNNKMLTGIPEFDVVLRGGLPRGKIHLFEGRPGTGKTTFALRFLIEGNGTSERCLYVTLSETAEDIVATAKSHDWELGDAIVREIVVAHEEEALHQSIVLPSELALSKTIDRIESMIAETAPTRIVIDSVAEIRLLAQDASTYRRQVMRLKEILVASRATVLLLDDLSSDEREYDLEGMAHGAILLEQRERAFGSVRRRLRIIKMRGTDFQSGWHDFSIVKNEVLVFPSLIADEHRQEYADETVSSGIEALDAMLGGGLRRGSSALVLGASGVGKSSLALQYLRAATRNGDHAALFSFDESRKTLVERAHELSIPIGESFDSGLLEWQRINPSRIAPGEFIWSVRRAVEDRKARFIVIDSLNSYLETMHQEKDLLLQMHELLSYLANMGVTCLVIVGQNGILEDLSEPLEISFIMDCIVWLRFYYDEGELHKSISVVKKRTGHHETSIREYCLDYNGVAVGKKLDTFKRSIPMMSRSGD